MAMGALWTKAVGHSMQTSEQYTNDTYKPKK